MSMQAVTASNLGQRTSDSGGAVLAWLKGKLSPEISGKRVMLTSYNSTGYFGIVEEKLPTFITRYQFEKGKLVAAPLNKPFEDEEVVAEVQSVGRAVAELLALGKIIQIETPREYLGAAVIYGLPQ